MASRVNTKFVVVLIVVLLVGVAGIIGAVVFFRANPAKHIEAADKYLEQGLTDKAVKEYGKALKKKTDDVGLMLKYVHALTKAKTSDSRTATGYVGQMRGFLRQAITQEPRNPVPFENLMQLYMKLGNVGNFDSWKTMYDDADARLKTNLDAYGLALAKKYRGISRVNRMQSLDLPTDEREQARVDLTEAIEQFSDDRESSYYLAFWHVLEAQILKRTNARTAEINELLDQSNLITAESLKPHPDDPRRQLDRIQILEVIGRNDGHEKELEEAQDLLTQVEQKIIAQEPNLHLVQDLVVMLTSIDREQVKPQGGGRSPTTSGLIRAEKVLVSAMKSNPDEPRYVVSLARVLEAQRRFDGALEYYQRVYQSDATASALEGGILLDGLRAQATIKYVELKLKKMDGLDQGERQEAIEEVESLMSSIVANHGETPQVNLLLGKIAMVRGLWGQASTKLDQASTQLKGRMPESLWLSAKAWVQMGELGAATDRLEQLAEVRPDYLPGRYELVRLYLRLSQHEEAQEHLDFLLSESPDDQKAKRAQAQLLAQQGQTEQAIDIYLSFDLQQHSELVPELANLYMLTGDQDGAIQILEAQFEEDPKAINILQALIRVSRDADQAKKYIEKSRQAGGESQSLNILESQFQGQSSLAQVLEGLIDADEVPFRRHLKRYRMFRRLGRKEEALEELEKAASLEPDHPMVVSATFDQALLERQWDRAETLAGRASAINIDMADGMFYYGRLEAARGNIDAAVAAYRRGLDTRPIYSEGWRQLGDVLRISSDWNAAVVAYRSALEQRPNNVTALTGQAVALHALDRQFDALECLRKAVRFNPDNELLRERYLIYEKTYGDVATALDRRSRLALAQPQNSANRRSLAVLLAESGKLKQAKKEIEELIQEDGNSRENIRAAAEVFSTGGDVDAAQKLLQDYVHGLGESATDADWMLLARFLMRVGNDEHAMAAYRQAIANEDPTRQEATREFSDLLFERGEYSDAKRRYEQLWQTSPDDKRVGDRFVEALLRVNEPERAREVLKIVTDKHGVDGGTHVLEALIARASGDTDAAMEALNRAEEFDPRRAIIYYQRADLQASNPDREKAVIADLEYSLELNPDLGAARRMLATIRVRRGEVDEAIRELRTLIRRHPRNIGARLQLAGLYLDGGRRDLRRALLAESAKLFPKAAVWPQLEAQQALLDNNQRLAIQKLEQAYALSRSPQTLGELSALLIQAGQSDDALALLRGEGEIVRNIPILHALRGRALMELGDQDLAIRAFTRAIERSDTFRDVANVTVQMSHGLGWDGTIEQMEQWIAQEASPLLELAIIQVQSELKNYDAAMERLIRLDGVIAEKAPLRQHYDRLKALVLYQQGSYEEALEVYTQMLEGQPNNLVTLNNAAYLLAESLGRGREALSLAERAVQLAPDNPLVLDTLGWAHYKSGQHDAAQHTLERSVKIKPSILSCMHLATVLTEQGQSVGAVEMLKQAKKLAQQADDQEILWTVSKRLDELLGNTRP